MRIAIDARGVRPKLQGVGRHVLNLLLGLSSRESDLEFLVFYNNPLARKLVERSGGQYRSRFQWIKAVAHPGTLVEKAEIPWLLRINNADLFHDVGNLGIRTGSIPRVVTVHELATLQFDRKPKVDRIRRSLKNARLIISVSQSLADEIETKFNVSRPRMRVISNAIDPWYAERVNDKEVRAMRDRFRLPGRYFLCVTADRASKNPSLVQKLAQEWGGSENFVFTMPGEESGRARYFDVVEDVWLRPLYAACAAVIVPSLYEGFSLPPLEALAGGTLPVVSDIPPHREIFGEVLPRELFFEANSPESLRKALEASQQGGEPLRASVLEKFRLVRDRYSFIETAQQVQNVYREALRG